jgi:hypothetical protein
VFSAWGCEPSVPRQVRSIEINQIFRVGLCFQPRVNRRLVEPQSLRDGGATNSHLPGRVHHEAHTLRNSSRTLPGLRQRRHSPIEEKRFCGVLSPSHTFHQSLPVRRLLRAPFSFSFGKGYEPPLTSAAEARLVGSKVVPRGTRGHHPGGTGGGLGGKASAVRAGGSGAASGIQFEGEAARFTRVVLLSEDLANFGFAFPPGPIFAVKFHEAERAFDRFLL